jgi:hypothetical protein
MNQTTKGNKTRFVLSSAFVQNEMEHLTITNKLDGMAVTLGKIEELAKITNGRIGVLERFRWMAGGALVVIIPVLLFVINTVLNNTGIIRKFEQMHKDELSTTPNSQQVK